MNRGEAARELERLLGEEVARRARRDHHAKRPPRPCGFTVHMGYNCPHACLYCYIDEMGFSFTQPRPYPLNGYAIAYALLMNRRFVPGREGSLIAIGSVSEPFHPALLGRTREFLEAAERFLGNPTQFSTKQFIGSDLASWMGSLSLPINPLVTIVTIRMARALEPRAPPVEVRLKTIENLRDAGLRPMIFVRPIIPGVTDVEAEEIGKIAATHGAVGAVVGGLRVTPRILERLAGVIDVSEIVRRIKRPLRAGVQVSVYMEDVKRTVINALKDSGLIVFRQACAANAWNAGVCPDCCRRLRCPHCEARVFLGGG